MTYLETKETLAGRIDYLKTLKSALVITGKPSNVKEVVRKEKSRIDSEIKYLKSEKKWNFYFVGGGWNYVLAKSKDVAIARAKKEYSKVDKVDEKSVRLATEEDTKALMSLFY
jgi:hypothetical protein